ncbi:hypothetical protein DFS34DRAFT_571614, partial [Phlyctochytrium arcticum]
GLKLPTFKSVKSFLAKLKTKTGNNILEKTTLFKNKIFLKDITKIVTQEIASPIVMQHLRFYGERNTNAGIRELYQAEKWPTDPHFRAPMAEHNN